MARKVTTHRPILFVLSSLALMIALLLATTAHAQIANGLQFEDSDPISVILAADKSDFEQPLTLRNNSTQTVNVKLSTILRGSDKKLRAATVRIASNGGTQEDTLSMVGGSVVPIVAFITLAQ